MVGSSKILTVSYGTFSCTLEGFDESFETMKAIAEYFRDLAADDRYFGAEPPTPDADMLARIAEREIARRVEAHEHEGRIVLRAQDNAAAGKALAAALSPTVAPEPAPEAAPAPAPEAAPAPEQAPEAKPDSVAETFATTAPAAEAETETEQAALLDAPTPEGLETEDEVEGIDVHDAAAEDAAPEDMHEAEDTRAPDSETDNLAARLDLIRSVVGASDSYDEDEHAQDFTDATASDEMTWDDAEQSEDDAQALTAQDEPAEMADMEAAEADEDGGDSAPDPAGDRLFEDTLAALLADAAPEGTRPQDMAQSDAPATEEATAAPPEQATEPRGARVLKVSRADVETARESGLLAGMDEDGEDTVNIFNDEDGALSPEDEAELQRELASLDAELGEDIIADAEDERAAQDEDTAEAPPPAPQSRAPEQPASADKKTEVSRIFDEADSQMADPGSVRRRNTIQHLRAALAATRAEKAAGATLAKKVDALPYRGDLDAAVRPRRAMPAPDAPRSRRPEEPRPAPLKLVAEQRVDMPQRTVRPRRVARPKAEVAEAQDKDFSVFAEELGATALPDLLEAAAAYLTDVEGRNQFSRPMLMGKLREIDEDGFSREEGLRSFGQLLREGKLQKLSGGRFTVTDETEFRTAAQRRAG
ncbi:pilus assembly protein FimV [Roseovarius sp. MBR-78]|uniref:hypothetical protein n=1 Tax=Roseovarius sp. MBR-78 TaxID=3156460 RepID=UPI0033933EB3